MKRSDHLLHHVQAFFQEFLSAQRGLSPNTVFAYRDTMKLYLSFLARYLGRRVTAISPDDLRVDTVLAFLEHIERERGNKTVTRNLRLSALRTFFEYMSAQDPLRSEQYRKIVAIPAKQAPKPSIQYLEVHEMKAILDATDREKVSGRRDYALLFFLYNTGARVQELCDISVGDLRLDPSFSVSITGKGKKNRVVPLWPDTADILKDYMGERGITHDRSARLFVNARGDPITRFGVHYILKMAADRASKHCGSIASRKISPHVIRHTTAMHLLQSGVDLFVIQSWLGHINLSTTHGYIEIDLEMKRKALSACAPVGGKGRLKTFINNNSDVICWLDSL